MYEVQRTAGGGIFETRGTVAAPPLVDSASPNTAYLYKVRAVSPVLTAFSPNDLATTVIFTDPVLTAGMQIKAVHLNEIGTAVNAVRVLSGAGPLPFSDSPLTPGVTTIKALHMNERRGVLDAARAALGLFPLTYSFTITPGGTPRASDVNETRNGVK